MQIAEKNARLLRKTSKDMPWVKSLFVGAAMSKTKIIDALDNAMSDNEQTLFTIELLLTKSPMKGVKCGGIAVYMKANQSEMLDFKEDVNPLEKFEAQKELNEMTEVMIRPLEKFKEDSGQWLNFAIPRVIEIFKELHYNADIVIKSPKLKIAHYIKRADAVKKINNPNFFHTAFDIDKLLNKDFQFDPWSQQIRRGQIGAEFK